ncbi:transcription factor HES-5-like [Mixophyes fleayi]|uniref:transcription factor HES-5-like n=1 Tax=Mixophyes fleayi TaxID=3061075 RepID=UPI003F4DDF51
MAPTFHMVQEAKNEQMGGLKKNKIRKPVIEKMRRDRINNSIEQIRVLLEKDIQTNNQHSKLEKADILEMAVQYLQQQRQHHMNDSQKAQELYYQGYYMCLKETMRFLHDPQQAPGKILRHLSRHQSQSLAEHNFHYPSASLQLGTSEGNREIWRPW